jgi:ABC-type taurine transport system ATPase subunit
MSAELITRLVNVAAFRPRSRLWELHELHVPLDELADNRVYEQRAITRLTGGACVAVLGPSGAGKSSMIAWTCYQLPASHFALQIPQRHCSGPPGPSEIVLSALLTLSVYVRTATNRVAIASRRNGG